MFVQCFYTYEEAHFLPVAAQELNKERGPNEHRNKG